MFTTNPPYGGRLELKMSNSKPWPEGFTGDPQKRRKNVIDDGFSAHLVIKSAFDGILEIPIIRKPDKIIVADEAIPFTKMHRTKDHSEFVVFYEHDLAFADVLTSTEDYLNELARFKGVVSPDCSLYRDMPLVLQAANTYMNRAVGSFLQNQGLYVVPNIRWGDERSFTTSELPEKIAFLGVERDSIVSIGTHGCCKAREDKHYLKAGLEAMLEELKPRVVLVYGPMPPAIFADYENCTRFVHYEEWTARQRRGGHNGHR